MADIPDGVSFEVARVAVAWEMTKMSLEHSSEYLNANDKDRLKMMTENFKEAYKSVINA